MYKVTIGMEIHAELKTRSKMFCASKNDPDEERPNVNICPVCLSHPGTLPVINKEAVTHVLRVGAAIGATLANYTEFDRKSYFYPDLPKGYQISQFEFPLVSGGSLAGIEITRIHLEEDTASSLHDEISGETLVDFNRAGVPLMELVTDPVIHSAEQASAFARELQLLLRYLGASEANMEKGQMRVEANISVSKTDTLGTKVEVKNLNSFRSMERAVSYEIGRQTELLQNGGVVLQETRGWNDGKQVTFAQRIKEGSADYRYFPDPDLPSLRILELRGHSLQALTEALPELPVARRARYLAIGIKTEDAELFVRDQQLGTFFEAVIAHSRGNTILTLLAANYLANDLISLLRGKEGAPMQIPISPQNFFKLMELANTGKLSSRSTKDILAEMVQADADPADIAKKRNLFQSNVDLAPIVEKVISEQTAVVAEYRSGKTASIEFLLGQCMKAMRGTGNPALLKDELKKQLQVSE